jgi:multidrug efflux pump subunit AcrB
VLDPWGERPTPDLQIDGLITRVRREMAAIAEANIFAFNPPAIRGLGSTGGLDFRLQALGGQTPLELAAVTRAMVVATNQDPALQAAFSTYSAEVPQIFLDLDRTKAESLNVPVSSIFSTLQAHFGSRFVNDFNLFNRVYQVRVQADSAFRNTVEDIGKLYVRGSEGRMVPLSSLVTISTVLAPQVVTRYNQFTSAQINAEAAFGVSSGEAMAAMARVAAQTLPDGYAYEWSSLSYQEQQTGSQGALLLALALVFGYLFLVGKYESWTIPMAVIVSISVATLGCIGRHLDRRTRFEYLCPDRHGPAGRPGQQKCHSDCGIRQQPEPSRSIHHGCGLDRRKHPLPGGLDDGIFLYHRRIAHGAGHRGRRQQPPGHRHHRLFGNARRNAWSAYS